MNLSNKQVQALVREILPVIQKHQKEKLSKLESELKSEVKSTIKKLAIPFNVVGGLVKGLHLDSTLFAVKLGIKKPIYSTLTFSSEDEVIQYCCEKLIKDKFIAVYGDEITAQDVEHEVIMSTMGADNVESLIEAVKTKLLK